MQSKKYRNLYNFFHQNKKMPDNEYDINNQSPKKREELKFTIFISAKMIYRMNSKLSPYEKHRVPVFFFFSFQDLLFPEI